MPPPQTFHDATAEAALNSIIAAERDHLRNFLIKNGASREDADEFANESFARLWRKMRREVVSDPRGYLFRTARNVAISEYRRSRAEKRGGGISAYSLNDAKNLFIERLLGNESFEVRASIDLREISAIVDEALATLSDRHREIFRLCVLDRLPRKEVGAQLKMSEDSVMTELHRAKKRLRSEIEPKLGARK